MFAQDALQPDLLFVAFAANTVSLPGGARRVRETTKPTSKTSVPHSRTPATDVSHLRARSRPSTPASEAVNAFVAEKEVDRRPTECGLKAPPHIGGPLRFPTPMGLCQVVRY